MFVGIDVGTSGCRACAIDAGGGILGEARIALPAPQRDGARCEQDSLVWWTALEQTLDELLSGIDRSRVRAIALDATSATVLATDAQGMPLAPALMYNDARAADDAERVARHAPPDSAARGPSASLAKCLYLLKHCPAGSVRHLLHQADWLSGRLLGRFGDSDENNCLKLGYDPQRRRWPEWIGQLGLDVALLPQVRPAGVPVAPLSEAMQQRFGLPAGVMLVSGTTDSTAAFIATGAQAPGTAVTSLGSTLVLKVVTPTPVFAAQYGVYSHRLGDLWLAGGASNSGGAVLHQWFTDGQIEQLTTRLDPDRPTGLDYYPLVAPGERFPINDPALAPRLTPRPADDLAFFQGLLESMARIEASGYRLLERLGAPYPDTVLTVGGGARNEAWSHIRARELGVPVSRARHEAAAYGSALLARSGIATLA